MRQSQTRKLWTRTALLLLLVLCADLQAQWRDSERVRIRQGEVAGLLEFVDGSAVYSWRGIPYAHNPVTAAEIAAARWRAPRDPADWEGVLQALRPGASCIQPGDAFDIGEPINGSEACHFVNVWRPKSAATGLPVYIDIHGGANEVGEGHNLRRLAARHPVVVVSFNYRLGLLSHLYHPALASGDPLDDSGNYNLLDTIKVLAWVQENIEAFGGDRNRVTIGGQSAGAELVWMLLTSPMLREKRYFNRAVLRSIYLSDEVTHRDESAGIARNVLIQSLYQTHGDWEYPQALDEADRLLASGGAGDYLRRLDARLLVCLNQRARNREWPQQCGPLRPLPEGEEDEFRIEDLKLHDGRVLPVHSLREAVEAGRFARVPLMLGAASQEARFFFYGRNVLMAESERAERGVASRADFKWLLHHYNPDRPRENINGRHPPNLDFFLEDGQSAFAFEAWQNIYSMYAGFIMSSIPARAADAHVPLWVYEFDWARQPPPFDTVINATHCTDLPFWFNDFAGDNNWLINRFGFAKKNRPGRQQLSQVMRRYWYNFIARGDPNQGGVVPQRWEQWQDSWFKKRLRFSATDTAAVVEAVW